MPILFTGPRKWRYFVSYSEADATRVSPWVEFLCATEGTRDAVFFAREHILPGNLWEEALEKSVRKCSAFLLFWSRSASTSEWVERELTMASKLNKRILPVKLDETELHPHFASFQVLDLSANRGLGAVEPDYEAMLLRYLKLVEAQG